MTKSEFIKNILKNRISNVFLNVEFTEEDKEEYEENFGQLDPDWTIDEINDAFFDLGDGAAEDMIEDLANELYDWLEGITIKQTYPEDAPGQLHLFDDDDTPIK